MKKHSSLFKFLVIIIASGSLGAVGGFVGSFIFPSIIPFFKPAYDFVFEHIIAFYISICGLLSSLSILAYCKSYSIYKKSPTEADNSFEAVESVTAYSLLFGLMSTIFSFFFFAVGVSTTGASLLIVLILLVFLSINTTMEVKNVNLTKKLDPRKHADPLEFKFTKDLEKECDEQERLTMYHASYKSFILLKYVILGTWLALCCMGIFFTIGVLPHALVCFFWAVHSISYIIFSIRKASSIKK